MNPLGTVSTLKIPKSLYTQMARKYGTRKVRGTLRYLLNRYRGYLAVGYLPWSGKVKTLYQDKGLDLINLKFRPNNEDWTELSIIAFSLGVTKCWLFSHLLKLDFFGIGEFLEKKEFNDVLATPRHSRPKCLVQITGKRRFIHRILHFRV
ncbi:MAG: DUF1564 family protein [Leptospiraceae bacterium]|nr:DUF1564 family protein [Leptospiraceae bacterium]